MNKIKVYLFIFCIQIILFVSEVNAQWIKCADIDSIGTNILTSTVINNKLYLGTTNGVYYSADEGISWNVYNSGLTNRIVQTIVAFDSINICVGTSGGGVFLSTNGGNNWNESNNGLTSTNIISLFYSQGILLAGCGFPVPAMFISSDKGGSWKKITNGPEDPVYSFNFSTGKFYAGVYGLYVSVDNGNTWSPESMGSWKANIDDIFVEDSIMMVATASGVFYSNDNGTNWTYSTDGLLYQIQSPYNMTLTRIAKAHSSYLIGSWNFGVRRSDDNGKTWYGFNDGLPNKASIYSFAEIRNYLYGNTRINGIYRRPLSDFVTNADQEIGNLQNIFSLSQNYPNPFNPTTTISFNLPAHSFISLKVFNALGTEIATLVTSEMPSGMHTVIWDAKNIPSGVYFYRLQANNYIKTNKMILLK